MKFRLCRIGLAAIVLLGATGALTRVQAQGLTGQISGIVTDSGGGVMPGATVTVKNTGTNLTRDVVTGADGAFLFPDLLAGTYDIKVSIEGFKTYEQQGLKLGATERVALRAITLEVGQLSEQVTVQAEATLVQTNNAARSGLVDRQKIDDIALKGRDFAGYLKLLPGVVDTTNREAPGWGSMGGLSINGRSGGFNFSYDGVTSKDTGSNSGNYSAPALDSIAEVRVQTSNFQAEYGRSSGATITVVTRSGSKDFRGSLAYYKRDDSLNGNEFSRRQQCGLGNTAQCDAPLYQFDNTAWTLGGPVLMPGTNFNKGRNKLFFFFSQDILSRTDPGNLNQRRVPTELERRGDFSQTFDSQNRLLNIRDPQLAGACSATGTPGPACFPGNVIPSNRIDPVMQTMFNLFPLPNATDPTGARNYNYVFQTVQDRPRNDQVLRMDWNVAEKTTFYSRVQWGYEAYAGGVTSLLGSGGGWPQQPSKYSIRSAGLVNTLLHTFSSTLYSEADRRRELVAPEHAGTEPGGQGRQRSHPRATRVPAVLPVGEPGQHPAERLVHRRQHARNHRAVQHRQPLAVLRLQHAVELLRQPDQDQGLAQHEGRSVRGAHHAAGAARLVLQRLAQLQRGRLESSEYEPWIRQRSARRGHPVSGVGRPSVGARPVHEHRVLRPGQLARVAEVHDRRRHPVLLHHADGEPRRHRGRVRPRRPSTRRQAPLLYQPTTVNGTRAALNPVNGQTLPPIYIGRFVPGTGNITNGMVTYDGTPQETHPFRPAPRIGFAWDVTGDGKTAVRGGAGVFYDRYQDDNILDLIELPPVLNTYTLNYTTLAGAACRVRSARRRPRCG